YPPNPNQSLVGFDVRSHPEGHATLLRAIRTKEVALSAPLTLVDGTPGFVLTSPIFRKGVFQGAAVCSFRSSDFFTALMLPEVSARYHAMVLDSGVPLFTGAAAASGHSSGPTTDEQFSLGGRTWVMRVSPREEIVVSRLRAGQAAFWTIASFLSLL